MLKRGLGNFMGVKRGIRKKRGRRKDALCLSSNEEGRKGRRGHVASAARLISQASTLLCKTMKQMNCFFLDGEMRRVGGIG